MVEIIGVSNMLKQLKYFQAVVRCNSFTEAAEECHISQSAISQEIQALENELGVKLLRIGYLKCYGGQELQLTVAAFSEKYPDVAIEMTGGNHEELYDLLRFGGADLVLNDQRRAFWTNMSTSI